MFVHFVVKDSTFIDSILEPAGPPPILDAVSTAAQNVGALSELASKSKDGVV